jgi:transposase
MHLSDHDLLQLDEERLMRLESGTLRTLAVKLMADLKQAREQLNRTPQNSSLPPGSQAPWKKGAAEDDEQSDGDDIVDGEETPSGNKESAAPDESGEPGKTPESIPAPPAVLPSGEEAAIKRQAGKQTGAPGFGRTQVLPITGVVVHSPAHCNLCDAAFTAAEGKLCGGHYVIDVVWGQANAPGISVTYTLHHHEEKRCGDCDHLTRYKPYHARATEFCDQEISEWRLVGPGLAALMVCLALRCRLSRKRIAEFLFDWLAIELSVGAIHQTIAESSALLAPAEEMLVKEIVQSELLHADETPWKEAGTCRWLWVFASLTATLYYVGDRSQKIFSDLLGAGFAGWLMSDGYRVYRDYPQRLRCWAHLIRKARGIAESLDAKAQAFGKEALRLLKIMQDAVYAAREGPPGRSLTSALIAELEQLKTACQCARDDLRHHKTGRALAVEFLNDWDAIFRVLDHPAMPLTNNTAERTLRHWVILRKICFGTRTAEGSKLFSLAASVIDTCRQRGCSPWRYLESAIVSRRNGMDLPPLPIANCGV